MLGDSGRLGIFALMWICRRLCVCLGAAAVLTAACGDALQDSVITETNVSVSVSAVSGGDDSAVPTEVAVSDTESRPGELAPPPLKLIDGDREMTLQIWTYCWTAPADAEGRSAGACADGWRGPAERLPTVSGTGPVYVEFPRSGWEFSASMSPLGDQECGRTQSVSLTEVASTVHELVPHGYADVYVVDVSGRGPSGDVHASFVWHTTVDGVLNTPRARLSLQWGDDGEVTSRLSDLSISGLAATPESASATVTVTTARGTSASVAYPQRAHAGCRVGRVRLEPRHTDAMLAEALDPMPHRYDVELVMDGTTYRAATSWPADESPDHAGIFVLSFDPALPGLSAR